MSKFGMAALVAGLVVAVMPAAIAQDAAKGRQIFIAKGCYACHGYNGQGADTGPKLAPDPLAADAIATFIRNANPTKMPQYVEKEVTNEDIAHIHAWLASQPKAKNYKEIPLLND